MAFEIIDADGHVTETFEGLARYLAEPYARRPVAPVQPWYPADGWDRRLFGSISTRAKTHEAWADALAQGGVAQAVLFPSAGLHIGFVRDPDWAIALAQGYNDFLRAEFTAKDSRLHGVALLPLQDPAAAIVELRRAVIDLGFVAGMLPADAWFLLGHPRFDPLYDEAERLDVPLCVHGSGSDLEHSGEPFPKLIQFHSLAHPVAQMRQLSSLVLGGALERHPKLRFAFLESGAGWVPFLAHRMDSEFAIRGKIEAPSLRARPSDYLRSERIFVACETDEPLLPQAVDLLGASRVLFASDFPHWDHHYPASIDVLKNRTDISEGAKTAIFSESARSLYRFK